MAPVKRLADSKLGHPAVEHRLLFGCFGFVS
jgi:hypothetical protein